MKKLNTKLNKSFTKLKIPFLCYGLCYQIGFVKKTLKHTTYSIINKVKNTILITFSYVSLFMVQLIDERKRPVKNPPKCPKASTFAVPKILKKKINAIIITEVQQSWYFRIGPTTSSPLQLIIIYPIITPITPYNEVEAPALTSVESINAEKMLPPIPERM